jgi:hypothetical protein
MADFALARLPGLLVLLLSAALAGILTSCASVDATSAQYVGVSHYPPSDPAAVQILRAQPTQPHERLGEVVIDASTDPAPPVSKVEDKVRAEAAKIGADAAVIVTDRIQPEGFYVTGGGGYWNWGGNQTAEPILGRKIVAVAIKYQQPPTGTQLTPTGR